MSDERLQRIEEKQDRTLERLSDLAVSLAAHIAEDRAVRDDVAVLKPQVDSLRRTAIAGKAVTGFLAFVLAGLGAWATGFVDIVNFFRGHK
jgi:hypothetical protein